MPWIAKFFGDYIATIFFVYDCQIEKRGGFVLWNKLVCFKNQKESHHQPQNQQQQLDQLQKFQEVCRNGHRQIVNDDCLDLCQRFQNEAVVIIKTSDECWCKYDIRDTNFERPSIIAIRRLFFFLFRRGHS